MIIKAVFQKFRTSEFIQFFSDITTICQQNNTTELGVQSQFEALKQSEQDLENSFKQSQKSELTAVIDKLDQRRDKALVCISKIADGYLSHYNTKK